MCGKDGVSRNYAHILIRTIRRMFTEAMRNGITDHYPFKQYELPAYNAPKKYFPTEAGLIKMIYHDTHDPVLIQAKVWFAFGCYSGLRISDMKLFNYDEHVKAGRLLLRPSKKSKGWVSMPVCNDLKRLLH